MSAAISSDKRPNVDPRRSPVADEASGHNTFKNPSNTIANRSVVLGVAAIALVGFGHLLLTDAGNIARAGFGLLVARLLFLASTDRYEPSLLPEKLLGIGVALLGLVAILRYAPEALLTPGSPFLVLALFGAATLFRTSSARPFLLCATAIAVLIFVLVKSPFWGGLLFVATALLMRRSLHTRLRPDGPITTAHRSGALILSAGVIGACALALAWVPSIGLGSQFERFENFDFDPGSLDELPTELGPDRSDGDEPSEESSDDDGRDPVDPEPGEGRGGTFETLPDGSVEFVPLEPGEVLPEGTVILEEANGGFGSDEGNGYVSCVDGELVYGEVAPGEDAPSQATPIIRRLVTDRKGDGRVLECGPFGVAVRDLGPDEEVPAGAVEVQLDDGRYDDIPRQGDAPVEEDETAPDDDTLTPSPFPEQGSESPDDQGSGLPNADVWKVAFGAGLAALAALLFWRWKRVPWLTRALWRLDRIGASYGRRLRKSESLLAFATDLPQAASQMATEFAECIDTYLFSGRATADPSDPPADVQQTADALLVAMKEQARLDRSGRRRRWYRRDPAANTADT